MQSDFHRMKNFANPKSMFKVNIWSCAWKTKPFNPHISSLFLSVSFNSQTSAPSSEPAGNTVAPGRPEPTPAAPAPAAPAKEETKTAGDAVTADATKPTGGDDAVRTEHLFKHPLQNTWTLWYLENDRSKSWEDMQNEITSFDTVEDFWSLYNHIKPPSEIKVGSDYSLFKKGIR